LKDVDLRFANVMKDPPHTVAILLDSRYRSKLMPADESDAATKRLTELTADVHDAAVRL